MKKTTMFLGAAAGAIAITLAAGCSSGDAGEDLTKQALAAAEASGCDVARAKGAELHIYTWSDYIAPDVIIGFENALGCKVVIDTFDSNEAMYAKLKAGATGYDIVTPTSYQIETMAKEGMIVPLDHSRIPNLVGFDERFAPQIIDPTFKYNVPYSVTYAGFLYNKNEIPEGADVNSWNILADSRLKGRMTLLDDIRETLGAGLMYLGYSINSTNAEEMAAAVDQLLKWRANIRKFDAESYKTEVPSGSTFLGHGYSTDSVQVIVGDEDEGTEPRDDIGFTLPKEGFSIAFDEMVLTAKSPRPDLAYAFMNYIYEPEVARVNMEYICGPVPIKEGIEKLDEEYRNLIILAPEVVKNGQVIRTLDDDGMKLYGQAWDKVKATEAR